MAKIAVESDAAATGGGTQTVVPGRLVSRVLAQGPGWTVAHTICGAGPRDRAFEEQHTGVTIAVVVSGSFQYRGAAGHELMTPGSLLLGNAGQYFECGHEHGAGDRCISFRFSEQYFEARGVEWGVESATTAFKRLRVPPLRELSPLVAMATAALKAGRYVDWEELGTQLAGVALGQANHDESGKRRQPLASELARVTRAVRMIEHEASAQLPLGGLAQQAGLSRFHFLRCFQQLTGQTPHQYVIRARLREAAVRLASGDDKVLEVALDCGFGDVSNFNHRFRAEFGCTPVAYRNRV